jgi:hypothetical protein
VVIAVSTDNVIPFRKRPPHGNTLEMYRRMTRNWSDEMKQIMFPDLYQAELQQQRKKHEG